MTKRFSELTDEEKSSLSVTDDADDESFVYCPACGRAMKQGDCVVHEDIEARLRCAYGDCFLNANIAAQNLEAWDIYRLDNEEETADWPEIPTPGECYKPVK